MNFENTNISARVSSTLKELVIESDFSHKDAYEIGAELIALGVAGETKDSLDSDPELKEILKRKEYSRLKARKKQLEKELKGMKD